MQIQINTDRNIEGLEAMAAHVKSVVNDALIHLGEHITRVEVHLSDENGTTKAHKIGQGDKRCMMEARLEGYRPLAVTAHSCTVHQSVDDAADKLTRLIESTLGRQHSHRPRRDGQNPSEETTLEE